MDEFLKAIAPNTVITLTGRSYDLTHALGYGVFGSKYYCWNEIYDDGWELEIDKVQNLTIRAARPGTEIVTVPSRIEMSASELMPSAPVEVSSAEPDSTVTESLPRRAVPAEVTFSVRFLRLRSSVVLIPLA